MDRAEATATEHGLVAELGRTHSCRGNIDFALGNADACLEQHEQARRYAREAGSSRDEANALGGLGDAYYLRGRMRTACGFFRRCVDLAREHGFEDIEVANRHMVGWSRLYLNELDQAAEDGSATAEAARRIGHPRAELLGCALIGVVAADLGRGDHARAQLERALGIARKLGARGFEGQILAHMARVLNAEGRTSEAHRLAEEALDVSRRSEMTFHGAYVLGVVALTTADPGVRRRAVREAEDILRSGCVGHNYFWFYRDAIETCLNAGEWDEAERFAAALESYTREEPLPWSAFYIGRGRALAAVGRGKADERTAATIERLHDQALKVGLKSALPALERARLETPDTNGH